MPEVIIYSPKNDNKSPQQQTDEHIARICTEWCDLKEAVEGIWEIGLDSLPDEK